MRRFGGFGLPIITFCSFLMGDIELRFGFATNIEVVRYCLKEELCGEVLTDQKEEQVNGCIETAGVSKEIKDLG